MDLQQPSLRTFAPHLRSDYARIFDLASTLRTDETALRVVDEWARRVYEMQPSPGQRLMMARPLSLAAQFRALFREDGGGKDAWFDADNVTSDGGTKLYSWNDRIDPTHLLYQATSGAQCNLPVADANFANAKTATFNGTSNFYITTRALSAFTFLHDGTGAEVIVTLRFNTASDTCIWSTWPNGAQGGAWHYHRTAGWVVSTPGGSEVLAITGSVPNATSTYTVYSLSNTDAPKARGYNKSTQIASSSPASFYATAPTRTFLVGDLAPAAGAAFLGQLRSLYLFRRVLSAADKTIYRSFIQADTGIAP